ncbi:MAG: YibE/F family protein [Chloroflexi bacterium]|nr:YibE/F family protein [Chloroflexota bacterium]
MLQKFKHRFSVRNRGDFLFVSIVFILCILLAWMPDLFKSPYAQDVERVRAEVIAVDDSTIQQFGMVKTGEQGLTVRILEGQHQGEVLPATNTLLGKMDMDKLFAAGDTAFVVLNTLGGQVVATTAYDHYRLDIEAILFLLFIALLVGFAGWTGVRAILSFVFAVLMVWKFLIPGLLMGWDPILLAFVIVALLTAVTMALVAGLSRAALVATLGSLLGVLLTVALAQVLFPPFHLHGAVLPYSETILYSGYPDLNLDRIFLAAIFIGASGAVMDLAIDVSASMNEVMRKRPDLSRKEAIFSGFAVGRAMTSTMVTTLLMAYVAGYIALLMVYIAQGIPPLQALNTNLISAEVLKTLVGSFGLVTVAPFTALVGGLIYVPFRKGQPSGQAIPADLVEQSELE